MRVVSFIQDPPVIKMILKHLGLWQVSARPPPPRLPSSEPEDPEDYKPIQEESGPDSWEPESDEQPLAGPLEASTESEGPWPVDDAPDPWLDSWPSPDPVWED